MSVSAIGLPWPYILTWELQSWQFPICISCSIIIVGDCDIMQWSKAVLRYVLKYTECHFIVQSFWIVRSLFDMTIHNDSLPHLRSWWMTLSVWTLW